MLRLKICLLEGFLWLNETGRNSGIHDVAQVVQWVKDNIEYFHGNKSQIILAGHGSGAAMASLVSLNETVGIWPLHLKESGWQIFIFI